MPSNASAWPRSGLLLPLPQASGGVEKGFPESGVSPPASTSAEEGADVTNAGVDALLKTEDDKGAAGGVYDVGAATADIRSGTNRDMPKSVTCAIDSKKPFNGNMAAAAIDPHAITLRRHGVLAEPVGGR